MEPELGQIAENGAQSPKTSGWVVSQTPSVGFQVAKGCSCTVFGCVVGVAFIGGCSLHLGPDSAGREQPAHVLDHHVPGLQRLDCGSHERPQPRAGPRCQTGLLTDRGDVLARKPTAEDVHRCHCGPVDGRYVTEVWGVRPVVGEYASDWGGQFGEPDGLTAGGVFNGKIQSSVSREQRTDPRTAIHWESKVVHEGSGMSGEPR